MINVVAAIITQDNKVFCARRKNKLHLAGYWEFPGGKVEKGETHQQSLIRELLEELNITVDVGTHIGQSTHQYDSKLIRLHAYLCNWLSGDLALNEHDKYCWLTLDESKNLKWAPADIALINQFHTYSYYELATENYFKETNTIDMSNKYKPFLETLSNNASILDLGCGSGRDSIEFSKMGYKVTAIDASPSMASIASENIGNTVQIKNCYNMNFESGFDGIWACASLLHIPKSEFQSALSNVVQALKPGGTAYISVKKGEGNGLDIKNRFFSYYQDDEFYTSLSNLSGIASIRHWQENDEAQGSNQQWLCALLSKHGK